MAAVRTALGAAADREATLRALREELDRRHARWREEEREARCPTGWESVDALLRGGFPRGQVTVVSGPAGAGRTSLAAGALAGVTRQGGLGAWIDPAGTLHGPALASFGIVLERLLWVRAARPSPDPATPESPSPGESRSRRERGREEGARGEGLWAAHLLVRSGAFDLVVVDLSGERLSGGGAERLAEAARTGRTAVLLLGEARQAEVPRAAVRIRLESSLEHDPQRVFPRPLRELHPVRHGSTLWSAPARRAPSREVSPGGPRRRLRLILERQRGGGEDGGVVVLAPPPRELPPWTPPEDRRLPAELLSPPAQRRPSRRAAGGAPQSRPLFVGGALEVEPLVAKLHRHPPRRRRDPSGESAGGEAPGDSAPALRGG